MGVETIILNILKIAFVVLAGHIALTKIIPILDEMLKSLLKDNKIVDSFTSLLGILVFVLVGKSVIEFATATENKVIAYLSVLKPGVDLLLSLIPYFGYIFAAAVVIIALKGIKK